MVRKWALKGGAFENVDNDKLSFIMDKLNNRPRKTLGYRTPNEVFFDNINLNNKKGL